MICPKCQAEIPEGSMSCPECKAEFYPKSNGTAQPAVPQQPQNYNRQPQPMPYPMPGQPIYGMPYPVPMQTQVLSEYTCSGATIAGHILGLIVETFIFIPFIYICFLVPVLENAGIGSIVPYTLAVIALGIWNLIDRILKCAQAGKNKLAICSDGIYGVACKGSFGTIDFRAAYSELVDAHTSIWNRKLTIVTKTGKYKLRISNRKDARNVLRTAIERTRANTQTNQAR